MRRAVIVAAALALCALWPATAGAETKADILFLVDTTGSMGGALSEAKAELRDVMSRIDSGLPDVQYAVADTRDYPFSPYGGPGDYAWRLAQPVTTDRAAVQDAVDGLTIGYGGDGPEGYAGALSSALAPSVGWRAGAHRLVVVVADNVPHDRDLNEGIPVEEQAAPSPFDTGADPGPDGTPGTGDDVDWQSLLDRMSAEKLPILFVYFHGAPAYLPYWEIWAGRTGGDAEDAEAGELADTIVGLVDEEADDLPCSSSECLPPPSEPPPVSGGPAPAPKPKPKPRYRCRKLGGGRSGYRCAPKRRRCSMTGPRRGRRGARGSDVKPNCRFLIALGDSVTSGHHNEVRGKGTTCDDPKYSYAQTVFNNLSTNKDTKERWKDKSYYYNFAHSGFGTAEVRTGKSGKDAAKNACGQVPKYGLPKELEIKADPSSPLEQATAILRKHKDAKNVVVISAGINDTNWTEVLKGVALHLIPFQRFGGPAKWEWTRERVAGLCESYIANGSAGIPGVDLTKFAGWNGNKHEEEIVKGTAEVVEKLREADKDVDIWWLGYYNMADTGTSDQDYKLTITKGFQIDKRTLQMPGLAVDMKERDTRFGKFRYPHIGWKPTELEVGGYEVGTVEVTPVKAGQKLVPPECVVPIQHRLNQISSWTLKGLKLGEEWSSKDGHTVFASPNWRDDAKKVAAGDKGETAAPLLYMNDALLQRIFPEEAKDNPPGWPHPNRFGHKAIGDWLVPPG